MNAPLFVKESAVSLERMCISINDLTIEARIGAYDYEKNKFQQLILNLEAEIDPPIEDEVRETVDYVQLVKLAKELAISQHFILIETYAAKLAEQCLALGGIRHVRINIAKPAAIAPAIAAVTVSAGLQNKVLEQCAGAKHK